MALLPINGLCVRPLHDRQVVMTAAEAARLTAVLQPRLALPHHYRFSSGWLGNRILTKKETDPASYVDSAARLAPQIAVRVEAETGVVVGPGVDRTLPRPLLAVLEARPGRADEMRELLVDLTRQNRREPGCLTFITYESDRVPGRFYLYEIFRDAEAFETHLGYDHVKRFRARRPEVSISGPADLGQLVEVPVADEEDAPGTG